MVVSLRVGKIALFDKALVVALARGALAMCAMWVGRIGIGFFPPGLGSSGMCLIRMPTVVRAFMPYTCLGPGSLHFFRKTRKNPGPAGIPLPYLLPLYHLQH